MDERHQRFLAAGEPHLQNLPGWTVHHTGDLPDLLALFEDLQPLKLVIVEAFLILGRFQGLRHKLGAAQRIRLCAIRNLLKFDQQTPLVNPRSLDGKPVLLFPLHALEHLTQREADLRLISSDLHGNFTFNTVRLHHTPDHQFHRHHSSNRR